MILVKALNVLLILHADHEQNFQSVRLVGLKANLYATIASGVNALGDPTWWCKPSGNRDA